MTDETQKPEGPDADLTEHVRGALDELFDVLTSEGKYDPSDRRNIYIMMLIQPLLVGELQHESKSIKVDHEASVRNIGRHMMSGWWRKVQGGRGIDTGPEFMKAIEDYSAHMYSHFQRVAQNASLMGKKEEVEDDDE